MGVTIHPLARLLLLLCVLTFVSAPGTLLAEQTNEQSLLDGSDAGPHDPDAMDAWHGLLADPGMRASITAEAPIWLAIPWYRLKGLIHPRPVALIAMIGLQPSAP